MKKGTKYGQKIKITLKMYSGDRNPGLMKCHNGRNFVGKVRREKQALVNFKCVWKPDIELELPEVTGCIKIDAVH